jgi:hypothetical protein
MERESSASKIQRASGYTGITRYRGEQISFKTSVRTLTKEYCTISTYSSVTGHSDLRREDFVDLSQVTTVTEEMDKNFACLRRSGHSGHGNLS